MKFEDDNDDFWLPENEVEQLELFDVTDEEARSQFSVKDKFIPYIYGE